MNCISNACKKYVRALNRSPELSTVASSVIATLGMLAGARISRSLLLSNNADWIGRVTVSVWGGVTGTTIGYLFAIFKMGLTQTKTEPFLILTAWGFVPTACFLHYRCGISL